ncbi:putative ABC transporter, ATP binding protein [Bradyrhizobium sp. STM 3843]|uniref:sugar ABC transporter ATP-binding protein n=1 Tax=Bradyrhizobium sp. STM 3843 TaxID=551947 RepID=UPI0002403424|nr:sugar ABC transporter ATP-binding protein [Bradyrhizobium sp. STM 3843]CCE09532.1 putative ABC transporter, ATP binding protein [Bradyrhizobium sp. STM 3843]
MHSRAAPLVEMTGISKEFPGVKALSGVHLKVERGEVHVLFGENGAGKSTLISILSGVFRPTAGSIHIDGAEVNFHSVHDATEAGIGTVFQEFSLVPTLPVFENLYLGRELQRGPFLDRGAMIRGAQGLFAELDFDIDVTRPASSLSRAQQQMVEIAKAFLANARVLILDEPTASLTERETERLFTFIGKAASAGVGIIYISHRIQEFAEIADRISILRDGRLIATVPARATSERELIELMTGRAVDQIYPKIARRTDAPVVMTLEEIRTAGVLGASLQVRAGEVLGCAGLVGSGKSRIWRAAMGLQPLRAGKVTLKGGDVTGATTRALLKAGVFFLPSDRKSEGLQMTASARGNIELSLLDRADVTGLFGFIAPRRSRALTDVIGDKVGIAQGAMDRAVSKLSGGNQQKVLFGKGFGNDRDVYIFDEPTVGVDMGTRIALYQLIKQIAEAGKAVVVISSDLPEVMNLSHRLLVFAKGRISAELSGEAITEENVLKHFFADTEKAA